MFTNVILTTFLAGLAAAAPALVQRQTNSAFSVIATHSTSAVHLQSVNANGGKFWIGKETSSYCPTSVVDVCPAGTVTAFVARSGGLSMDTEVPGGQQAYIAADGSLSFTTAHSAYIPPGSQTSPFTYTPQNSNNTVGNLAFGSNGEGFFACPAANSTGVYQVFATTAGNATTVDCIGINLATYTFDGVAAWQYA